MLQRQKCTCGAVRCSKTNLPEAGINAKLKPWESVLRCHHPMLALKWCNKRGCHSHFHYLWNNRSCSQKKHTGEMSSSLQLFSYISLMSRINLSDQYLTSYSFFEKEYEMAEKALYPPFQHDFVEWLYTPKEIWWQNGCHIIILTPYYLVTKC